MRNYLVLTAAALLTLGAAGCSQSAKEDGRECLEVPASVQTHIAEGANETPIEPVAAAGVRSEAFADATVVAMSFKTPDGEVSDGAWAVGGNLEEPGVTLALDGFAHQFTDWPNEVDGKALTVAEDGVAEAQACLAHLDHS